LRSGEGGGRGLARQHAADGGRDQFDLTGGEILHRRHVALARGDVKARVCNRGVDPKGDCGPARSTPPSRWGRKMAYWAPRSLAISRSIAASTRWRCSAGI